MGFERYGLCPRCADVFCLSHGKYINALGQSFRDFLKGQLPALPGEVPTLRLGGSFDDRLPEARIKKYMEMRGADGGPWRRLCVARVLGRPALRSKRADAAWDLVKGWDAETREALRVASVHGLQARVVTSTCMTWHAKYWR